MVFSHVILLQGLGYFMQTMFLLLNKYSPAPRSDVCTEVARPISTELILGSKFTVKVVDVIYTKALLNKSDNEKKIN